MRCPLVLALALAAGCTSISVAGGPVRTDGKVAVHEHKSGTKGAALELGGGIADLSDGDAEVGIYLTGDVAGYSDNGDGDLIHWFGLSVRYRRYFATTAYVAPFFAVGGGPGTGGGYGDDNLVLEAHAELGARLALGAHAAITLSVRDRPAMFIGEGGAWEPLNTLQAAFGIEVRPGGKPAKRRASETQLASRRR